MSFSIQTNVTSLLAQQNIDTNQAFQARTISRLTSGYRINSSGDDAAGLAVANLYRSNTAELTQGVRNANDGISSLQIIDGGLNNISHALDRLKTLATQSASTTFTGNRATLNTEYQQLLSEVSRQATNVGLNAGGKYNTGISVYLGGSASIANAQVNVDLSGNQNAVDSASLGIGTTNVLAGGVGVGGATQRLDTPGNPSFTFGGGSQAFTFNYNQNGTAQSTTVTLNTSQTATAAVNTLNATLNSLGINASVDNSGQLQFSGSTAFNVTSALSGGATAANSLSAAGNVSNTSNHIVAGQATYAAGADQNLTFQTSSGTQTVKVLAADTIDSAISKINAATSSSGVFAILNSAGTGIDFQGSNSFSVYSDAAGAFAAAGNNTASAPATGSSTNATSAITALNSAVQSLGLVQGRVGTGENKLQYAIDLAQSQIGNYSAAESHIRDTDVAAEAANLTKAQVLQQASIAALAQANSAPQAVLALLRG